MIFDADVLIRFLRVDPAAARLIESQSDRAISIISAMELLQGARSRDEIENNSPLYSAERHTTYSR